MLISPKEVVEVHAMGQMAGLPIVVSSTIQLTLSLSLACVLARSLRYAARPLHPSRFAEALWSRLL